MGLTQKLGTIPLAIQTDSSNNVGIGGAANASYKLAVTGAGLYTGNLNINGETLTIGGTTNNAIINNIASIRVNIDCDNTGTGESFTIGHNQTAINDSNVLFRVQDNGNVGIGTSSPINALDVRISSSTAYSSNSAGNVLTLYNTSTTTGAYAGIDFISEPTSGNAGRAAINMIVTGSGTADLAFSTRNSTMGERMRITSGGAAIIGSTGALNYTSLGRLNVQASGATEPSLMIANSSTSVTTTLLGIGSGRTAGSSAFNFIDCLTGNSSGDQFVTEQFKVRGDGVIYAQNTSVQAISSDIQLKTDIKDFDKGLKEVLLMKPRYFKYKDNIEIQRAGFIAQEMDEAIIGSMVDSSIEGYKTYEVDWNPILVKAIQEQQEIINQLSAKVTALENK